jgi:hypothetical protein
MAYDLLNLLVKNLFNILLSILLLVLISGFLWWMWRGAYSTEKLRESLFRNVGVTYRNLIGLLLGVTASLLPLTSGTWSTWGATWIFVGALGITMALLVAVRPKVEKELDQFAWGLLVIIVLGFGLGALIFQARPWWVYLWRQYLKINNPGAILLEALFLLGVILGFFVVRNWAKEQKDFVSSLSAVLSGAFLATILGKLQEGPTPAIGPLRAFAFYALGFTMSGTINLLGAARLTANYVNKRSLTSRALLDFLYGSERAKIIDGYFLKNFEEDKNYARKQLTDTLIEYRRLVAREFAERMEARRKSRQKMRRQFGNMAAAQDALMKEKKELPSPPETPLDKRRFQEIEDRLNKLHNWSQPNEQESFQGKRRLADEAQVGMIIEILEERRKQLEPACAPLKKTRDELNRLQTEKKAITSSVEPSRKQKSRLKQIEDELKKLQGHEHELKLNNSDIEGQFAEWSTLEDRLGHLKPSYFYWLIAIECEEKDDGDGPANPGLPEKDRLHDVVYKYIGSDESWVDPEHSHVSPGAEELPAIDETMFRVGVGLRRRDLLEYVVAPGEYGKSFPIFGSVSGLALTFKQTIVMDRDMRRTFRDKSHNLCPKDIEQDRGLDEVDFLSYISIPVVNRHGDPVESGMGVVNIDTKLFVTRSRLHGEPVKACEGIFRTRLKPRDLTEYANSLYEQDDEDVKYIEDVTKIIAPVVVLYAKCQVGAT